MMGKYGPVEKLEEFSNLEGTEVGEYWNLLVELSKSKDHFASTGFSKAVTKEVDAQIKWAEENFEIEEGEKTSSIRYKRFMPKNAK